MIDPRDYGAVGNNVDDDTAALQRWAEALSSGTINLPYRCSSNLPGHFRFSDEIEFAPAGNGSAFFDFRGWSFNYNGPPGIQYDGELEFDKTAGTIRRTDGGDFVAEGWVANRWIEAEGTTENDARYYVSDVTGSIITVEPDYTSNDAIAADETVVCTLRDRKVLFRFGNGHEDKKWFYSELHGLYLGNVVNKANITGVEFDHTDFMTVIGCVVSVGGLQEGSRCIDVSGFSKQGKGSVNSLKVINLLTAGAETGFFLDQSNVCTIIGGKCQQHVTGLRTRGSSGVNLQNVDFSLNTQNGVFCESTGNIVLSGVYCEANGPKTKGNDAKLFYFKDSNGITMTSCSINATYGALGDGTHPKYGVYLENCEDFHILGSRGKLSQRALIYADADCRDIVIERSVGHEQGSGYIHSTLAPMELLTPFVDNRAFGRALTPLQSGLSNLVNSNVGDASWTKLNGATVGTAGTVPGVDPATGVVDPGNLIDVVELPSVAIGSNSQLNAVSSSISSASSKTIYMRVLARLVAMRTPDPADRDTDLAVLRLLISEAAAPGNNRSMLFRIGPTWDWYELTYPNPPNDGTYNIQIWARIVQEPIDIAIQAVEAYAI